MLFHRTNDEESEESNEREEEKQNECTLRLGPFGLRTMNLKGSIKMIYPQTLWITFERILKPRTNFAQSLPLSRIWAIHIAPSHRFYLNLNAWVSHVPLLITLFLVTLRSI